MWLLGALLLGCSADDEGSSSGPSGGGGGQDTATGTGGSVVAGGASAVGGGTGTGGSPTAGAAGAGSGGTDDGGVATSVGGAAGSFGGTGSGGVAGTGGTPAAGTAGVAGSAGSSGSASSGGAPGSGGATGSGGLPGSGGAALGSEPFGEGFVSKTAPDPILGGGSPPTVTGDQVAITVDPEVVLQAVPQTLMGNNLAVWQGEAYVTDPVAVQRLQDVSPSLLRFPGGSSSDEYHWDGNYPAFVSGRANWNNPWALSTSEYLALVEQLGAIPIITVNHGYATYDTTDSDGTLANATALAADWVEYCNSPNDGSNPNGGVDWAAQRAADGRAEPWGVRYWEVGNEVYGDWETGYQENGADYGAHFVAFVDAMKAVDPSISVGVVGAVGQAGYDEWTKDVLATSGVAERADFIDVHDYFRHVQTNPIATEEVLDLAIQISENKAALDSIVGAQTSRLGEIKYYLGEFHCTNPNNPHTVSLVSGLFVAKVLGELIANEFAAASLWDVANGWDDGRQGDHGFLAKNSPNVPNFTPRPSYYPFFFYTRNFGDLFVPSTSSDPEVVTYASRFSSGELGLILINESDAPRLASIDLGAMTAASAANAWVLTGSSLDSFAVSLNGIDNGLGEGGPAIGDVTPYYFTLPESTQASMGLPAHSVVSLIVY